MDVHSTWAKQANKNEALYQKELQCQREKEALLTQYKLFFPDKSGWSREHCTSIESNSTADKSEQQARKMLSEVDGALKLEKKGFSLETPLLNWYIKIKNYIKMDEEKHDQNNSPTEKSLCMADKMFYDVKYQTEDGHQLQLTTPLGKQGRQPLPGRLLEKLLFSTRHKGTCVHVTIARRDSKPPCSSRSPLNADNCFEESESYVFTTDPYVTDCHQHGLEHLIQSNQPEKFIKDAVWKYIDTETN